jgi:putative membrane protein
MRFVVWLLTNAAGVAVAAWLLDGISFTGPDSGQAELEEKILPLLLVALILGAVTAVVKPILTLLSLPLVILTIGLFLLVINAAMLLLTGWIAEQADIGFTVDGFWAALLGSVVITVVTWAVDNLIGSD